MQRFCSIFSQPALGLDRFLRQRGQVVEQTAEVVQGFTVSAAFGQRLALGAGRWRGGLNRRAAPLGGVNGVVFGKQQRRQGLPHVPLDIVGQHT